MKIYLLSFGIAFSQLLIGQNSPCQDETETQKTIDYTMEQSYDLAKEKVRQMKYDSALLFLELAFNNGLEDPTIVVSDDAFYGLINDPKYRPKTRSLLKSYSYVHQSTMVRSEEPGKRIALNGKILDGSSNKPIKNVIVGTVHAADNGLYFEEESMWNPRLFTYVRTDDQGEFRIMTILPGSYNDDNGDPVPAHIHFTIEAEGYRPYGSEFTFEDDPVFKAKGNVDEVPVAKQTDPNEYSVVLYMNNE